MKKFRGVNPELQWSSIFLFKNLSWVSTLFIPVSHGNVWGGHIVVRGSFDEHKIRIKKHVSGCASQDSLFPLTFLDVKNFANTFYSVSLLLFCSVSNAFLLFLSFLPRYYSNGICTGLYLISWSLRWRDMFIIICVPIKV